MIELKPDERRVYSKYANLNLPRHTSYPIAPMWKSGVDPDQKVAMLSTLMPSSEVSLYVHIPFCRSLCYYCACTREIVGDDPQRQESKSSRFLRNLEIELASIQQIVGQRKVQSIHFGGGTPTFLTPEQIQHLVALLNDHFDCSDVKEFSCEIDPRVTSRKHLEALKEGGCNRLSLGVQDFKESVQKTINRIQPYDMVKQFVATVKDVGFDHLNFDLIYGLPGQTIESVRKTIEQTLTLRPTRIAFYRLAVIPDIFKWQKTFSRQDLPEGEETLDMMLSAIKLFEAGGYKYIGLDHFALPDDKLFEALESGSVTRNFQGMTTGAKLPILGFGPSSISSGPEFFYQNVKSFSAWSQSLETSPSDDPIERGLKLNGEDRLRQDLLQDLYCYGQVDLKKFGADWQTKFSQELADCTDLCDDGIITSRDGVVSLEGALGRLLVRVVASVFDTYLPPATYKKGLPDGQSSKTG